MGRDPGSSEVALTSSAHVLVRSGIDEKTGEVLSAAAVSVRVGWCAALIQEMTARLLEKHWNAEDVREFTSGLDAAGRPLPKQAWMALRRLGWAAPVSDGVAVNDRICRMVQEQAGRLLRSAAWRSTLIAGVTATWPEDPAKRTSTEWDAVRAAIPGGEHVPTPVIRARTRQAQRFEKKHGRLPQDVFELEHPPAACPVLLLASCDSQEATIARSTENPGRALLRVKLPTRPDPRSRADWSWTAIPLALPPTVPATAVLHLPTLRIAKRKLQTDLPFTRPVPAARQTGHEIGLGVACR